ncbi:hypothetical protein D3C71_1786140 [compost metagenome]
MRFRYGGSKITVAFIGHQINGSKVSDGKVTARNPDIRLQKLLPQHRPGKTGEVLGSFIACISKLLCEHFMDLRPVFMQRRGHNM